MTSVVRCIATALAWSLCCLALAMAGCSGLPPMPTPTPAAYTAAFKACLANEGVSAAGPEGAKVFSILDQGGNDAAHIEAKIEAIAITLTASAALICVDCAVMAWEQSNPLVTGKPPTKSQAAARIYRARHLASPTLRRSVPL